MGFYFQLYIYMFQFDDGKANFEGEFNVDNIKNFVKSESIALVTEFSDEVNTHLVF